MGILNQRAGETGGIRGSISSISCNLFYIDFYIVSILGLFSYYAPILTGQPNASIFDPSGSMSGSSAPLTP